jgi:hypothetical protein
MLIAKHAEESAQLSVSIDWAIWYRYIARLYLRAGDQRAAARSYWRAARAGDPARYGVGALCLTVPRLWNWLDRQGHLRVPSEWSRRAETWLEEMRTNRTPAWAP